MHSNVQYTTNIEICILQYKILFCGWASNLVDKIVQFLKSYR